MIILICKMRMSLFVRTLESVVILCGDVLRYLGVLFHNYKLQSHDAGIVLT